MRKKKISIEKSRVNCGILIVLPILLSPLCGHAVCPYQIHRDPVVDLQFLQKASIICDKEKDPFCEKDNRETYEEFAANRAVTLDEIHKKYSATGAFYCGEIPMGTANVVRRNDILVLSAHQFYANDGSCKSLMPKGDFSSCYFETIEKTGARGKRYYIKSSTLEVGTKCPGALNAGDDWAVVQLKESVKGVQAYNPVKVKDLGGLLSDNYDSLVGLKTITAAAQNTNFKKHPLTTPSLCDDSIRGIQAQGDRSVPKAFFIASACSATGGSSGAGVLLQSPKSIPDFIGLVSDSKNSKMDYKPFGPDNFTSGPLLEGRFYETLMRM